MNEFLIRFLDLFGRLFRLMGVNYIQVRAIVSIKLTMDNRRQIMSYRRKDSKEPSNAFSATLLIYLLLGGFISLALYAVSSFVLSMIFFFAFIMVMVAMTLITDFSSVLLDTSDNTIILPRPVDSRTLFTARITHILLYLGQVTAALSIIPLVIILLKYGTLLFFLSVIASMLSVLTAVCLTNAFYLLILQFANEEKLKTLINYFQIIMAIFVMGGYQLLPRMAGRMNLSEYYFEIKWWSFITPPVWMAAALETFYLKQLDLPHIAITFCAVVFPLLGFYFINRYLTPIFNRKLGVMSSETKQVATTKGRKNFASKISSLITVNGLERGSFELIYHILGRDRRIKLKIYPSFGYVIVFGVIFMLRGNEDFVTTWNNLPNTQHYLMLLYLTFMILQAAIYEIPYSDDFKASWIYFSTPLKNPGDILTGMLKAIIVRLFIPGYLLISLIVIFIWGTQAVDDVVFGLFNNLIMLLIMVLLSKRHLPLSFAPNVRSQFGSFIRTMMLFLILGLLGLGHYLLTQRPIFLMAGIPFQLALIYFLNRAYRNTTWNQITL
jgi:ABC-2 type transport system permease protein